MTPTSDAADSSGSVPAEALLLVQAQALYDRGHARQALRFLDAAIARTPAGRVRTLLVLQRAGWLRETGQLQAALSLLERAEAALARQPREERRYEWIAVSVERAIIAQQRGDLDAAVEILKLAEAEARLLPLEDQEIALPDVLANLGSVLNDAGRFSAAQEVILEALEIDRRTGNASSEAHDLNLLGMIYQQLGDTATARAYFEQSLTLAREELLDKRAADAESNLAGLAVEEEGAAVTFASVGDRYEQGGDRLSHACSVANQGLAAFRAGRHDLAARLIGRARELHIEVGNWSHSIFDQIHLSQVELSRGNSREAVALAEVAVAEAGARGVTAGLWNGEYALAFARIGLIPQLPLDEAGSEMKAALAGLRRSIDIIELLRTHVDRPEERQWLLTDKEKVYRATILILVQLGSIDEAFSLSERARARVFLESVGTQRMEQLGDSPWSKRRVALADQLLTRNPSAADKERILAELRALRAREAADRPGLAAVVDTELPTTEQMCAAIPENAHVISCFQLDPSQLVLFLLGKGGLHSCYKVSLTEPLDDMVRAFLREVEYDETPATGERLMHSLIGPFMGELQETYKLFLAPHGSLHYVPWSALWFRPDGDESRPPVYLKDRFLLTALPSVAALPRFMAGGERAWGPAVVIGNPTGELRGADEEARCAAEKLGVAPVLGEKATRRSLLDALHPVVLHVACHGTYHSEDPLLSALHLSDGSVTVEDLLTQGPQARLVVFSGCLTGVSQRHPGDELVGLARAALLNGAMAVLATLWETSDNSSAVFFDCFYDALTRGLSAGQSLSYAQQELSREPHCLELPADWGPFVLIGNPDMTLSGEPPQAPQSTSEGGRTVWIHRA
ncbi:CHAT domain-containing tetratricopeptide repeat protein [Streptomyces sp. NPDC023838]|uniref:CHAT domain-containing protein n=1 Tax=Streptomyces sp. NPDC023838 TaxID=3154325 RepID=UPI0033DD583A